MSDSRPQERQNSLDNVLAGLAVGTGEAELANEYLLAHDFASHTRRAIRQDLRRFAAWCSQANQEPFMTRRVTTRDVVDFRDWLRRNQRQEVSTVNRRLVTIRRYLGWLVEVGHIESNPAKKVKELQRQRLAPKGLEPAVVRRLLRDVEVRNDLRAAALFSLFLYTGCRVSDLVGLELHDIAINDRSGTAVFRHGKGNKQRTVPLPLAARKALQSYLAMRPPSEASHVFVGERGPLTDAGVRTLCRKFSTAIGVRLHPHLLRHTFAKHFLASNGNDLVSLAQILGHENLNTTSRYSQQGEEHLAEGVGRVNW